LLKGESDSSEARIVLFLDEIHTVVVLGAAGLGWTPVNLAQAVLARVSCVASCLPPSHEHRQQHREGIRPLQRTLPAGGSLDQHHGGRRRFLILVASRRR